jgi:hypothetical protein
MASFGSIARMLAGPHMPACLAEIVFGLTVNHERRPLLAHAVEESIEYVRGLTVRTFPDGSTHLAARGVYRSDRRHATIREYAVVIRVYSTDTATARGCREFEHTVRCFASRLAKRFQQESVLVSITQPHGARTVAFVKKYEPGRKCRVSTAKLPAKLRPKPIAA